LNSFEFAAGHQAPRFRRLLGVSQQELLTR